MRIVDLIIKKREGGEHSREELQFIIDGYLDGSVGEEQISAWLMAVYFRGMSDQETAALTDIMQHSGDVLTYADVSDIIVDKHSTGGVGDKTTLVVAPLVAASGVPIAKLSGRGLGFTGGTLDKLESIPGLRVDISGEAFRAQLNNIGIVVAGQTANLVPADKKLYALRDITGTIESIPLIASSIMSKKLASGANKIVLDVKFGSGAFMQQPEQAKELAKAMVKIGNALNRQTVAVLSSMDQPLGYAVGNTVEVQEAIDTLEGHGPADFTELCLTLAGHMIFFGGKALSAEDGYTKAKMLLGNGIALEKFYQLIKAQGGSLANGLPEAEFTASVYAARAGIVQAIDAKTIGHSSMLLGAGRETKHSIIDPTAGIILRKKVGETVEQGEVIAELHYNTPYAYRLDEAVKAVQDAYMIDEMQPKILPLILDIIE
ncbi:MAG: thymidine phosphorylase [Peptococcaceae bacterium]|nr:thymidine phosphorylase [Peptococcaceae bacterium]